MLHLKLRRHYVDTLMISPSDRNDYGSGVWGQDPRLSLEPPTFRRSSAQLRAHHITKH